MRLLWRWSVQLIVLLILIAGNAAHAEPAPGRPPSQAPDSWLTRFFNGGSWYFSFGYSRQGYAATDIHVSQPSQGNDFIIHAVRGHDEVPVFHGDPFVAQYNIRLGHFLNEARTFGVELNFDHTKYTTTIGQMTRVTGVIGGVATDANFRVDGKFFSEVLHNGANHVMLNAVFRHPLVGQLDETFSLAFIGKAGAGFMLPHTSDTVLGTGNNVGSRSFQNLVGFRSGWWQLNGWTTGVEAGLRFVVAKPFYIELTDKLAYADLSHLPAAYGTLNHSLLMNEVVLSFGIAFGGPGN